ncbi:MAG: cation-transporting P-type ATPase [Desulfatiglandales bacterium]
MKHTSQASDHKNNKDMEENTSQHAPWAMDFEKVLSGLRVDPDKGLIDEEVKKRRDRYGMNRVRKTRQRSAWEILADQFKSLIILLLAFAAGLSFAFEEWIQGVAVAVVIVVNCAIGFFTELNALRSMEALQEMTRVETAVCRNGEVKEIPAEELVPGDIVVVEAGDIISADLRVFEANKLQVNESALTGESLPVSKTTDAIEKSLPLAERRNMLFKGTSLTGGSGHGVVVSTGMDTELGKISELTEEAAQEEKTPLEKRLNRLGHRLIWLTLGVASLVAVSGLISGRELFLLVKTSIALAVAAIPEGLPIVATIALARGMWRMANLNAVVNRLSAVETLGSINVIFTDKTGTLTENRMTVKKLALFSEKGPRAIRLGNGNSERNSFFDDEKDVDPHEHQVLRKILETGVLSNNASLDNQASGAAGEGVGDPMEVALLVAGLKAGMRRDELLKKLPEVREEAFDPKTKMMATYHRQNGRFRVAVKGSPEAVLKACTSILSDKGERKIDEEVRSSWLEWNERLAEEGLRVLAAAEKEVDREDADPYKDLTCLGLIGLFDPPRKDVKEAIDACRDAGIRAVMVTGDQPVTAKNIALAVGLIDQDDIEVVHGEDIKQPENLSPQERGRLIKTPVFCRVTPEQKLDLIQLHQKHGSIVAMTGDGVNDAPALKKADIGVAMGKRGTEVAQEAADMVLKDDAFPTIVVAVEQGRAIFDNIRKFILYLLSGNIAEIMIVGFAILAGAPLPILPLQILYLNMLGDVFPALALGLGKGDPSIMERPPREPKEPILTRGHWFAIGGYGILICGMVLAAFALAFMWLEAEEGRAVTVSFLTLAFARLWHTFNMRDPGTAFFRNEVTTNPFVWAALALCAGLLVVAIYLPGLSLVLSLEPPGANGWLLILGMSLVPWAVGQVLKIRR